MSMRVLCRVGWHKWVNRRNDEGLKYRQCSRCGKEDHAGKPVLGGQGLG